MVLKRHGFTRLRIWVIPCSVFGFLAVNADSIVRSRALPGTNGSQACLGQDRLIYGVGWKLLLSALEQEPRSGH